MLSLTAQGSVFDGSDELGLLVTRTLACDEISVRLGAMVRGEGRHVVQAGTPVEPSILPMTPDNNDGGDEVDSNNYVFGYYSDFPALVDAMSRAGIAGTDTAEITIEDTDLGECTLERTIAVTDAPLAFTTTGEIPDPGCG